MTKLNEWLKSIGACEEAIEWAEKYNTLPKAWRECHRADWLLWLAGKMCGREGWPTRKQLVLAADAAAYAARADARQVALRKMSTIVRRRLRPGPWGES